MSQRNYSLMTAILCWSGIVVMSSLYVTIPLMTIFADLFRITLTQAAAAGSAFSVGFAIGCLIYGPLSEKYGRKKVIVFGLIALTLFSLLLGSANHFAWIIVLRSLQGAAAATFSPVALAYAVEMFPAEKRVTAIGFISTGFLAAGIIGQVISSFMSQQYSWHAVFYMLAALYFVTLLVVMRWLPKEESPLTTVNIWDPIKRIPSMFKRKNIVLSYIIALVLLMSFVNMYTVLGSYLAGPDFGLSNKEILLVRTIGVVGMLISPLAGGLAKRFGLRTVLRFGLGLAVVSMASLGMISNLSLLIGTSVLFVAGIALSVPSLITLIGQLGGKSRGIAVSVYTFILFSGTSLGPILSIRIMNVGSYGLTFVLLAIVLGIGLLAACLIHSDSAVESISTKPPSPLA
ncbi:MFS transporter [Brevibacillus porteri]|uniref:MFS transporter n=1 Tax=Brevibacillus porteri TaxID=2126350 RepID=A0ABX5FWN0_9BACL|nr:MFS transporter [Brevibacillus porteri]MED1797736.1 MFS transporter [Brevibacillus porteri]MED2130522.1 MFS transporter [Brevibacillus porteri]MED2745272.1 MFS transporter [Brevibacillus porteri]MED2812762.1 MFS transporter [Brevibacillus porteri]MED2895264.1 MFS transporter [Brevibacillus porteri]